MVCVPCAADKHTTTLCDECTNNCCAKCIGLHYCRDKTVYEERQASHLFCNELADLVLCSVLCRDSLGIDFDGIGANLWCVLGLLQERVSLGLKSRTLAQ